MSGDAPSVLALKHTFGFVPSASQHHFQLIIPTATTGVVVVHEHYSWNDQTGSSEMHLRESKQDGQIRVQLKMTYWQLIADAVRTTFNVRLQRDRLRAGIWKPGVNLLRSDLGKELLVLMWAIEDAESAKIPVALRNWNGFLPEERWWLYTQTAAATGHATIHHAVGWRRALRYALTEQPAQSSASQSFMRTMHVASTVPVHDDDDTRTP